MGLRRAFAAVDKMVTRGRLSIPLQKASKLSKEWGEGQAGDDCVQFMYECAAVWQRMPEVYPHWLE
jgi:hypothetical protein